MQSTTISTTQAVMPNIFFIGKNDCLWLMLLFFIPTQKIPVIVSLSYKGMELLALGSCIAIGTMAATRFTAMSAITQM